MEVGSHSHYSQNRYESRCSENPILTDAPNTHLQSRAWWREALLLIVRICFSSVAVITQRL